MPAPPADRDPGGRLARGGRRDRRGHRAVPARHRAGPAGPRPAESPWLRAALREGAGLDAGGAVALTPARSCSARRSSGPRGISTRWCASTTRTPSTTARGGSSTRSLRRARGPAPVQRRDRRAVGRVRHRARGVVEVDAERLIVLMTSNARGRASGIELVDTRPRPPAPSATA